MDIFIIGYCYRKKTQVASASQIRWSSGCPIVVVDLNYNENNK